MPIHPDIAARFPLLAGLSSLHEAYTTPAGLAQIRQYESWEPVTGPPSVDSRTQQSAATVSSCGTG